jgi:hypothetical protein
MGRAVATDRVAVRDVFQPHCREEVVTLRAGSQNCRARDDVWISMWVSKCEHRKVQAAKPGGETTDPGTAMNAEPMKRVRMRVMFAGGTVVCSGWAGCSTSGDAHCAVVPVAVNAVSTTYRRPPARPRPAKTVVVCPARTTVDDAMEASVM